MQLNTQVLPIFVLLGSVMAINTAKASLVSTEQSLNIVSAYHNNLNRSRVTGASWLNQLNISLPLAQQSDNQSLQIIPSARLYYNNASSDSYNDNMSLQLSYRYNLERFGLNLSGVYSKEDTLFSELQDSGRGSLSNQRYTWSLTPGASYALGELTSFQVTSHFSYVGFGSDNEFYFSDYRIADGGFSLTHSLSERLSASLQTVANVYEPIGQPSNVYSIQGLMDISYAMTERSHIVISGGLYTSSASLKFGEMKPGQTVRLSLSTNGLSYFYSFDIARQLSPSSLGSVQLNNSVNVLVNKSISSKVGFSITASYIRNDLIFGDILSINYNVGSLSSGLDIQLAKTASLSLGINHIRQYIFDDIPSVSDTALSVSYRYVNKTHH